MGRLIAGDENTRVTWVRTDGPLQETAVVRNTLLILPMVEHTDQGTYRCLASNQEATVYAQVTIIVEGEDSHGFYKNLHLLTLCLLTLCYKYAFYVMLGVLLRGMFCASFYIM